MPRLKLRWGDEVEVPSCERGLTIQNLFCDAGKMGWENRIDQRMPPEPATGSFLHSEMSAGIQRCPEIEIRVVTPGTRSHSGQILSAISSGVAAALEL